MSLVLKLLTLLLYLSSKGERKTTGFFFQGSGDQDGKLKKTRTMIAEKLGRGIELLRYGH